MAAEEGNYVESRKKICFELLKCYFFFRRTNRDDSEEEDFKLDDADDGEEARPAGRQVRQRVRIRRRRVSRGQGPRRRRHQRRNCSQQGTNRRR